MDLDAPERPRADAAVPDGSWARSAFFLRHTWALLRSDRALVGVAAVGLLAMVASMAIVMGAFAWVSRDHGAYLGGLAATVASLPSTLLSTYVNVALVWAAGERLDGREATLRAAFAAANRRWRPILAWSLLATGVGALLQWLADKLPFAGALTAWLAGAAWSVATLFVVPVLVFEEAGARQAARRSVAIFRARWGEGVTGTVALGAVTMPALAVGGAMLGIGIGAGGVAGVVLVAVGVALMGVAYGVARAVAELFALAVYRHVVLGRSSFGFEPSALDGLIKLKSRKRGG